MTKRTFCRRCGWMLIHYERRDGRKAMYCPQCYAKQGKEIPLCEEEKNDNPSSP